MKSYSKVNGAFGLHEILKKDLGETYVIHYKNETNFLCGWNKEASLELTENSEINEIDEFIASNNREYIFTALSYDLKNSVYPQLKSENQSEIDFPLAQLFVFENVIIKKGDLALCYSSNGDFQLDDLSEKVELNQAFELKEVISEVEYSNRFKAIIDDIQFGNIYEINYCIPLEGKFNSEDFMGLEKKLIARTQAPFGAIWNTHDHYILSSSPERFIRKDGRRLISQPIKGTKKRGTTLEEDQQLIEELSADQKERSENIMIVDLVRNDLSRVALKNSVNVDELCGIYTFETVHQMISTVSCEVPEKLKFSEILMALFPMGSMTGAPKISAMEISEREENFKRGIYSGALGYIEPNGNFDFNVVIRSFIANKKKKTFTAPVGGAITIKANSKDEYAECLLKLDAIKKSLS